MGLGSSNNTESSWGSNEGPQSAVLHRFDGILGFWFEVYGAVDERRHVDLLSARLKNVL